MPASPAPPVLEAAPPASAALVEPAAPFGAGLIPGPTADAALAGDNGTGLLASAGSACPGAGALEMLSGAAPLPPCAEGFAFRAPSPGPLPGTASLPHAMALRASTPTYRGERKLGRVIGMGALSVVSKNRERE